MMAIGGVIPTEFGIIPVPKTEILLLDIRVSEEEVRSNKCKQPGFKPC